MAVCILFLAPALQPLGAAQNAAPALSSVDLGTVPRGVAVGSGSIYAVLYLNGTTLALNAQTLKTVAKIATPSPYAVAVDPATGRVYVSQGGGSPIAVIDGSSDSVVATINGTGTPYALAVDEGDGVLLCADTGGSSLWLVNTSTDAVGARVPIADTSALAVDPTVHEAFAGNVSSDQSSGSIDVVNTTSMSLIRAVQIPIPPGHFSVDPSSHLLFVSSAGVSGTGANFLAIDDRTFQTVYSLHLGESPNVMAVDSSSHVYVSDSGTNRLYEIDAATGQVLLNSTGNPNAGGPTGISFTGITGMAVDPQTGSLYITENDVTSLIVLTVGSTSTTTTASTTTASTSSSTSSVDPLYLLVLPAVAVFAAALFGMLYMRGRQARRPATSR